ncbi:putative translation initiation factor 2 subunit beta (aeIF-2b) [Candidatus Methanoperedens nitroreducens]|uniref:Translation initiation factor 2 subunit beta n=1 Tax=Candidatus Methanoperedens nitratireducens TaxID=1392998 RepID=A0A062V3M4_9EURY|nr:translation initiation factor IF-2 subunit beta [Candidatus Methanoperedens nitroreducens]KCZ73701.1 putative translation initiation factor 2 subunit beta (aeIF-2b) [Candidatus Methanoperedens nitroreducens]MDJ1422340.1 translation initiation factor IF-2 subunit beta [Candidatus Methanoperedens sp.]
MNDYLASLDRALAKLPEIKGSGERFVVPEPKLLTEGKTTVLENFAAIADRLNREPEHIFKFLLRELGTAGKLEGSRAVFQGRFTSGVVSELIDAYIKEYVTCSECGRPDTHLIKIDRILTLRCDACGAHRPVTKRQIAVIVKEEALVEGETYEVMINAVGRKGDGIAKKDKYTIYVPGVVKGDIVKAKIKKISGNLAFAELIEKK